jgi:DNA-binding NarL/FixJ family response regulator
MARTGIAQALLGADVAIVASCRTLEDAVAALPADALLLSDGLTDDIAAAIAALRADHPRLGIIVLVDHADVPRLLELIAAGARGILLAGAEPERIPHVVTSVVGGGVALPAKAVAAMAEDLHRRHQAGRTAGAGGPLLTHREYDVLAALAEGLTVAQVARRLEIAAATVRRHAANATHKLGVADRDAAVRLLAS